MTTQVIARKRKPAAEPPEDAAQHLTEDGVRHYTPEEISINGEKRFLLCSASWLKREANARRIPHTQVAGRIAFRLDHIRAISEMFEVPVLSTHRAA